MVLGKTLFIGNPRLLVCFRFLLVTFGETRFNFHLRYNFPSAPGSTNLHFLDSTWTKFLLGPTVRGSTGPAVPSVRFHRGE